MVVICTLSLVASVTACALSYKVYKVVTAPIESKAVEPSAKVLNEWLWGDDLK